MRSGKSIFPKIETLPEEIISQLNPDNRFQSQTAQNYDLSWQAVLNGYIGNTETNQNTEELTIKDNYRFIRKHFHFAWVFYVLLLRLISFYNPFKEIAAWLGTRQVKQLKNSSQPITYPKWENFQSDLINDNPKVSVIIPTLNRYHFLKDVLTDLEQQDYKNFEVIVVDQSEPFKKEFYAAYSLDIQLVRQEEKALWLARNSAIKLAKGEFIALSEDDVRIESNWISSHLKCMDFFDTQVSAGVFYPQGQQIPKSRSFFAIATQFATGNAMLYKNVFREVGLFDRQFEKQRMGDGEFGLRVYLHGIKSVSNPIASCIDVKAGTGGLREMGSWDSFRPSNFLAPRPIPSVLYYFRKYYGNKASRFALLRMIPISIFPYQFKKNKPLLLIGVFVTILLTPIVLYQVCKSWHRASQKLKQGSLIERL
jgi:glycosyltransferase involved in cell wall biosynthesis